MNFKIKMDARGRITLPKMIREALKMAKGDAIQFGQKGNGAAITIVNRERRAEVLAS